MRSRVEFLPPFERVREALFKKGLIDLLVFLVGENAEGNERMGMIKPATQKTFTGLKEVSQPARNEIDGSLGDFVREGPEMPSFQSPFLLRFQYDGRVVHG